MPLRPLRPAVRSTASAVVIALVGWGTLVPATADDTPLPVAVDDVITVDALGSGPGGVSFIDVLANDSAADGEILEICRVQAPERGLAVAEADSGGRFSIQTPEQGISTSGDPTEEDGRESLVVLPWRNRAGTYQFTYWACDSTHLTPATVTVTVKRTPLVKVRKLDRPGLLRFINPRTSRAVVLYGGLRSDGPDGRVGLGAGDRETRRVERRAILWFAFSPRTGALIGEGIVRGIRLPGSASRSGAARDRTDAGPTRDMLRAWRSAVTDRGMRG